MTSKAGNVTLTITCWNLIDPDAIDSVHKGSGSGSLFDFNHIFHGIPQILTGLRSGLFPDHYNRMTSTVTRYSFTLFAERMYMHLNLFYSGKVPGDFDHSSLFQCPVNINQIFKIHQQNLLAKRSKYHG